MSAAAVCLAQFGSLNGIFADAGLAPEAVVNLDCYNENVKPDPLNARIEGAADDRARKLKRALEGT